MSLIFFYEKINLHIRVTEICALGSISKHELLFMVIIKGAIK